MKTKVTIYGNQIKETEKAIQFELIWFNYKSETEKKWTAWMPKSQIEVTKLERSKFFGEYGIDCPSWLASKIDDEITKFQGQVIMGRGTLSSLITE